MSGTQDGSDNVYDNHMAADFNECLATLKGKGQPTFPTFTNGTLWCNATFDSFLCWPAIPANTTYSLPCPPLRGLMPEKQVLKHCHESGRWFGHDENDFSSPYGYTDYIPCMKFDPLAFKYARQIASGARKLEYVGLTLSLISLLASIMIFSAFRRLRVFRNQMHQQLMLALLLNVTIRLILYIDQAIGSEMSPSAQAGSGYTINSTRVVCEAFYLLLEYLKTAAFTFSFLEGFYLHQTVVVKVFHDVEPKLSRYLGIGWGLPVLHVLVWIFVVLALREDHVLERCLGDYYMTPIYFWIMDILRLIELLVNFGFLLNIVYVLWLKVKETQNTTEMEQIKKSVKAAMMLIPLLGLPNILQTIPLTPNRNNLTFFAVYTYCASFFFMFQGLMVAVIFCFTNKEVINVVRSRWKRYRQAHQSTHRLRQVSTNAPGPLSSRRLTTRGLSAADNSSTRGSVQSQQRRTTDNIEYAPLTIMTPKLKRSPPPSILPPSYDDVVKCSHHSDDVIMRECNDDVIVHRCRDEFVNRACDVIMGGNGDHGDDDDDDDDDVIAHDIIIIHPRHNGEPAWKPGRGGDVTKCSEGYLPTRSPSRLDDVMNGGCGGEGAAGGGPRRQGSYRRETAAVGPGGSLHANDVIALNGYNDRTVDHECDGDVMWRKKDRDDVKYGGSANEVIARTSNDDVINRLGNTGGVGMDR